MASLFLRSRMYFRLVAAAGVLLCLSACSQLLFYPSSKMVSTPARWQLAYDDIWLHSEDGTRLHGWWLPAQVPGEAPVQTVARGSVYFLHGNAENISTHIASVSWLPAQGYNVFLLDYRGYGRSDGRPTLGPVIDDVRTGYRWLLQQSLPVIVLGQSLGGGLAGFVAATEQRAPAAVVLDAPVASYPRIASDVARRHWLTWLLAPLAAFAMPEQYDLDAVIAELRSPLLVFGSDEDRVVPASHADTVFGLAREPKKRVKTSGRHIATFNQEGNRRFLLDFLAEHVNDSLPGAAELGGQSSGAR